MTTIELKKVVNHKKDPWLRAISGDYDIPRDAQVFSGWGLHNDRVAVWVGADGGGFGAIDQDPVGYVKFSRALDAGRDPDVDHPGVDEYVFEPGTFDPAAETIEFDVNSSLF